MGALVSQELNFMKTNRFPFFPALLVRSSKSFRFFFLQLFTDSEFQFSNVKIMSLIVCFNPRDETE